METKYKILLIGDKVGKTNYSLRITNDTFVNDHKPTQGLEVHKTEIEVDSKKIGITLFDTNIEAFYKNTDGFIIIFDLTSKESFKLVDSYLKKAKEYSDNSEFLLIGNKMDLKENRQVDFNIANDFALKNNLLYFEVSSKTGENISPSFKEFIQKIFKKEKKEEKEDIKNISIKDKLDLILEKEKELNQEKLKIEEEKKKLQKELGIKEEEFDEETKKVIENFEQTQPGCLSCNLQ